jgi:hypothetical protein
MRNELTASFSKRQMATQNAASVVPVKLKKGGHVHCNSAAEKSNSKNRSLKIFWSIGMAVEQKLKDVLEDLIAGCSAARHALRSWSRLSGNAELRALLATRGRFYLQAISQLRALHMQHPQARCTGPALNVCGKRPRSRLRRRLLMAGDQTVLNACEQEEARVLMRYRDALDFELPPAAENLLRQQFGVLLDQHASLLRLRARVKPVELRVLALAP